MEKSLSTDTKDVPAAVLRFAKQMAERMSANDAKEPAPTWRDAWKSFSEFGLLSLGMPPDVGGVDISTTQLISAMEMFGYGYPDNGFTMGLNSHLWTVQEPIRSFGSAEQQAHYLPPLVRGDIIGAFALTEEKAGSDAMNMDATAIKSGTDYVLNGEKCFIGMATACDVAIVFARTAPDAGAWGITAFLVEASDRGFEQGPATAKHGLTTLPFGRMRFKDCAIPEGRRLGPEGSGARIFQKVMDWERSFILATHVGAMRRQLHDCSTYAENRVVFGAPIKEYQSVSNRLADIRVRLETSELMLRKAAEMKDDGTLTTLQSAMTNLHISEAFLDSSMDAVRTFGGRGYLESSLVGQDVRDALGGVIYSGTSDIQRQIITRMLLLESDPFSRR